jgi:hypothetical protein
MSSRDGAHRLNIKFFKTADVFVFVSRLKVFGIYAYGRLIDELDDRVRTLHRN